MLARLLYGLGAATGGSLLSQFPEYYIHYVQRLGGRVDQARLRAAEIREDAATMGLSVEDYVASFLDSAPHRSEEHTSELQSLMRNSYAVFCLKKKKKTQRHTTNTQTIVN